jgi:serine/threonine-protein kinase HipA
VLADEKAIANAENIVSQSMRFLLEKAEADKIVREMEHLVRSKWYEVARREGVSETDCGTISRAFAYPGFRFPLS